MASLDNIHHYLRKYKVFPLIQTCENIELADSKNCNLIFSLVTPFYLPYRSCGPQRKKSW